MLDVRCSMFSKPLILVVVLVLAIGKQIEDKDEGRLR
jgi:hypothetical protein